MPQAIPEAAVDLMLSHLVREADAGFPRFSRIPCSETIKFLDYFAALTEPDQAALLASKARVAALQFLPPQLGAQQMLALMDSDPAFQRYRQAMRSAWFAMGMRHAGLRDTGVSLKDPMSVAMRAQTRARLDFTPRDDFPLALVPDPDPAHLKPAKAPQLRKLIDTAFKGLFAPTKQKRPGGELWYEGVLEATPIRVSIGFTNRGPQLLYHVRIPDETRTVLAIRIAYDTIFAGSPGWDYLTEENAETSIALLCEFVVDVVRLRNDLMPIMQAAASGAAGR